MIGILTFYWADDYGAMLQSYALKYYLNTYTRAVLIPYFPKPLQSRYCIIRRPSGGHFLRRICKILRQMTPGKLYSSWETKRQMNSFRKQFLIEEEQVLTSSWDIYTFYKDLDTYVVGSDQVWNPEITEGIQEGYFCTFRKWKKEKARYVAYAASIGSERLKETYTGVLAELLPNFDAISLRESSSAAYIKELYEKELAIVLDPVFLLSKREWERLLRPHRKKKRGYIMVYETEYNPDMADYLKRLEERTGLSTLLPGSARRQYRWTRTSKYIIGCGPREFLELLYHADYVVTNSFHGTAMSILFQKQFVVFAHSVRNARIQDLLRTAHLEKRMMQKEAEVEQIDRKIDWERTQAILQREIMHSKEFITREIIE